MSHEMELSFIIFAVYFGLILFSVARNFYRVSGKSLKRINGPEGQDYFFSQRRYGKYKGQSIVSAGMPVQNGFVFSICRKTFWHRFLTPLGLAQDLKTGDPLLDDAFYFMADDEEKLKTLLGASGFVAALRAAFDTSKTRDMECIQDKLWFNAGPINDLDVSEQAFAGQAARLAQEVEKLEAPGYQQSSPSFSPSRVAFLYRIIHAAFLMLALVLAATLLFRNEDIINTKDFFLEAASISLVVVLLWLMLLMVIFGKTSWFPQVCSSFALSGLAGLVLLTGFMVRDADIDLDHAQPDVKTMSLQSKQCSLYCTTGGRHASSTTYPLTDQECSMTEAGATIADYKARDYRCKHTARINYDLFFPWPTERTNGDTGPYKLAAKAESYERAQVGQSFAFPIYKGYLGLAWNRKGDIRAE